MKKLKTKIAYLASLSAGISMPLSVAFAQSFRDTFRLTINARPAYASDLVDILQSIAGFLIITGGVLAGIAVIVSGILWMSAGSNSGRVDTAKAWFKNGVIGALILFAVGLIIQTILLIATDPFGFLS